MSRIGAGLLLLAGLAPAQSKPEPYLLLLADPATQHVEGATVVVFARPLGELVAMRDFLPRLAPTHSALPAPVRVEATSDKSGHVRLLANAASTVGGPASGWAVTPGGLGALLVDLRPGRAQRVTMQPMAAVTTTAGDEDFVLFASAMLPSGDTVVLPPLRAGRVEKESPNGTVVALPRKGVSLPAGVFEVWAHSKAGWTWRMLDLVSGATAELRFDGAPQRLRSTGAYTHPHRRPEVDLFGGEAETTLRGGALAAPLVAWSGDQVFGPHGLPGPASERTVRWPVDLAPQERRLLGPAPAELASTPMRLFGLLRSDSGAWQLRACSTPVSFAGGPSFPLPDAPPGDAWLLFVADGHAPQAAPWTVALGRFPFDAERGAPLRVSARDGNGVRIANLALEYAPADMIAACVRALTDDRGEADLGLVRAPGVLRVSDPRFANVEIALDRVPLEPLPVEAVAGGSLRGRAEWPDGAPAIGALVSLRDPRGVLRPATRDAIAGKDGTFVFEGLPEQALLVLFATAQRDGRTWSGKLERVRAGADEVLVLRDEDPQILPPGGR